MLQNLKCFGNINRFNGKSVYIRWRCMSSTPINDDNCVVLKKNDQIFHILGISRNSYDSGNRINMKLNRINPDRICMDICHDRLNAIKIDVAVNYRSLSSYCMKYIRHEMFGNKLSIHAPYMEAIKYAYYNDIKIKCLDVSCKDTLSNLQYIMDNQPETYL